MNAVDLLILRLALVNNHRRDEKMVREATALNEALEAAEITATSVRAREEAMDAILQRWPRAAVVAIADTRGFHNLARIARRTIREELVA